MRLALAVLLMLLFVPKWSGHVRYEAPDPRLPFALRPVALFPGTPAERRFGALRYERGYVIEGNDMNFGGFSSILTDGRHFTLLSDGGDGIGFTLDAAGRLSRRYTFSLPNGPGAGWEKADRDSESLARDPATGQFWVGFETSNQIWRYAPGFARAETHAAPPAMARWSPNKGAETMARLADGRFVVIAEGRTGRGARGRAGIVFAGDPARGPARGFRFRYLPPEGFSPTDAAQLPDGRLILLNRRADLLSGFSAVVTIADLRALRPGAVVKGREIARLQPPALHDNFEGIAAVATAKGTRIWIVSDDNQTRPWQESYLLEFSLAER